MMGSIDHRVLALCSSIVLRLAECLSKIIHIKQSYQSRCSHLETLYIFFGFLYNKFEVFNFNLSKICRYDSYIRGYFFKMNSNINFQVPYRFKEVQCDDNND